MNNYQLNTNWCLWYHSINDTNWKKNSYKNLYTLKNLYDVKCINDIIDKIHLQNGMFFIMRENIFPTWEDPDNRNGCCISFKVPSSSLKEQWNTILNSVLSEDILRDSTNTEYINGISIAPKKEFNIIKLWLRDGGKNHEDNLREYSPFFTNEKGLIKKHALSE